ncbi:sortilin, putative [Schistosoma mansoni]|uniref:sortilin, putative n=1 Tax=Schistosoma mansoni TaxID=6183 RepID=UPI00022C8199|nr:sortilin, putative [Schistosoma mansoni]|eukprot:XP_018645592.1 sortilin, putative [Schistosoma mansoni]
MLFKSNMIILLAVFVLTFTSTSLFGASSSSNVCDSQQKLFDPIIKGGKALEVFYFVNDTKETIQLTWAGENSGVLILVTMTEGESGPGLTSDIYRRSVYEMDPGETVYILYHPQSSKNASERHILAKSSDFGLTWTELLKDVIRVWAPRGVKVDIPRPHDKSSISFDSETEQDYETTKLGHFLYASHFADTKNQTVQLSVSTDGGQTFNKAHLPTIQAERFYSVLEVEDDSAFVHVDAPNDTGYGALFISDISGAIFSESLRHHLYPNHAPVTDFYRVASMRGTYLATRLNPDRTLYTVITHDRGASWHPLGTPINVQDTCQSKPATSTTSSTTTTTTTDATAEAIITETTVSGASMSTVKANTNNNNTMDNAGSEDINDVISTSDNSLTSTTNSPSKDPVQTNIESSTPSEIWRPDPNMSDLLSTDPSSVKVCGLQISNQFSIKNRVIASPPLSIAAAPGLILAHGHVATHLKNTPADVFVSSDGGYTWLKALDGPHHYQIANRGGLIVAVPAETLWPDVLRFSTDEGKCWHTIPLRTGQWSINESNRYQVNNNEDDSMKSQTHHDDVLDDSEESLDKIKSTSVKVTDIPSPSEEQRIVFDKNTIPTTTGSSLDAVPRTTTTITTITTTVNASTVNNISNDTNNISPINQLHADSHQQFQTNDDKWSSASSTSSQRTDEIVVFTGLVTEPGGRAMAAAVYGYGTATQRWRVAVVDFRTNGMIKRKCTPDDYETWIPHSSNEGGKDGCLLGVREQFKRLKKDSLCANEYEMETRVQVEFCPCTQSDYECEYGFYRQPGSLNCIRNPYIPPLDPCTLPRKQRQTIHQLGYRLIPGDRCVGGWQPPIWNQTILDLIKSCPYDNADDDNSLITHNSPATIISIILLIFGIIILLILWMKSNHYRMMSTSNYRLDNRHFKVNTSNALNRLHNWFIPWKRNPFTGLVNNNNIDGWNSIDPVSSTYNDSRTNLWPPTCTTTSSMHKQTVHSNLFKINCIQPKIFNKQLKTTQMNNNSSNNSNVNDIHHLSDPNKNNHTIIIPKKTISIPTFKGGSGNVLHQYFHRHDTDSTNLLEAEEIPSTSSLLSLSSMNTVTNNSSNSCNPRQSFGDPLTSFAYKNSLTKLSNGSTRVYNKNNKCHTSSVTKNNNHDYNHSSEIHQAMLQKQQQHNSPFTNHHKDILDQ